MSKFKVEDIIGVIFDFNGTMFFDSEKHIKAWTMYIEELTGEKLSDTEINMRVWERGSGETLACGTGACASVYACMLNKKTKEEVTVHLLGGDLHIKYDKDSGHIFMMGPAVVVFDGELME